MVRLPVLSSLKIQVLTPTVGLTRQTNLVVKGSDFIIKDIQFDADIEEFMFTKAALKK